MAHKISFPNVDGVDHTGLHACQKWLTEHGFSYGQLCRDMPIGVIKGDCVIAKWRNLNHYERQLMDGEIHPQVGGWRGPHGGATLILSNSVVPADAPQAEVMQ